MTFNEHLNQERARRFGESSPKLYPERYKEYLTKKRREQIHKESKFAGDHKNLPFTFSKPKKPTPHRDIYQCEECGHILHISASRTHAVICRCNNFIIIEEDKINVVRE